ncbi:MAG: transglycosylase SLT domain-containing protein [Thermomicrobiales bacterium]|nr:transglycosylase SLT domain-containing protein [Thermomicrobiales bacterium]
MNAERFDDAVRRLQGALTRRAALGAFLGMAAPALVAEEGEARRWSRPGKKRNKRGKKKADGSGKKKRKNKDKKKKNKKGSGGSGERCQGNYTEKEILDFIASAAKKYGQSKNAMVRVARCESNLDPCAVNRSGPYYGLFQFLKSTWNKTPYGDQSIYDPKAQAMAAAWMWSEGRKNEWACK